MVFIFARGLRGQWLSYFGYRERTILKKQVSPWYRSKIRAFWKQDHRESVYSGLILTKKDLKLVLDVTDNILVFTWLFTIIFSSFRTGPDGAPGVRWKEFLHDGELKVLKARRNFKVWQAKGSQKEDGSLQLVHRLQEFQRGAGRRERECWRGICCFSQSPWDRSSNNLKCGASPPMGPWWARRRLCIVPA